MAEEIPLFYGRRWKPCAIYYSLAAASEHISVSVWYTAISTFSGARQIFFFFNAWWSVVDKQNIWTYDYCCYICLRCHSNRVQDSVHKNRIQFSKNKTQQIIAISRIHLFDLWVFCFQFFLLFKQFITRFDCTYHCFSDWAHAWSLEFCNDSWLE